MLGTVVGVLPVAEADTVVLRHVLDNAPSGRSRCVSQSPAAVCSTLISKLNSIIVQISVSVLCQGFAPFELNRRFITGYVTQPPSTLLDSIV